LTAGRKHFLLLFVAAALAAFLASCRRNGSGGSGEVPLFGPPEGVPYDLTIVHTNDIHAQFLPFGEFSRGGLARHATIGKRLRAEAARRGAGILFADAGDLREGTLFYDADRGVALFRLMEDLRYDVLQVGNHDHLFGVQALFDDLSVAFPGFRQRLRVLWGNVNPTGLDPTGTRRRPVSKAAIAAFENAFADEEGTIDPARMDAPLSNSFLFNQTLFFERNGLRVGLFGLDTDDILYRQVPGPGDLLSDPASESEGLLFYDPVAHPYAAQMVAYLEDPDGDPLTDDGADVIVAVSHDGLSADLEIARRAVAPSGRAIDVLVSGHSHTVLNRAVRVDHGSGRETAIVQAGSLGEFVGRIDLRVDRGAGRVEVVSSALVPVDPRTREDGAVKASIAAALADVETMFASPHADRVAESRALLASGAGGAPSALAARAGDAFLGALRAAGRPADLAVVPSSILRQSVYPGGVRAADAFAALPLHDVDATGLSSSTLHVIDLPGGIVNAPNPLRLADPDAEPAVFFGVTRLEFFLETVYSLDGFAGVLGQLLGEDFSSVGSVTRGITLRGVEASVDLDGPLFDRIDPGRVAAGGVPLSGNEDRTFRVAIDSQVARLALPIVALLVEVEDPPGSGRARPLFDYDPRAAESGVIEWEAFRDALRARGAVTLEDADPPFDGPRPLAPDLTVAPRGIAVDPPAPRRGSRARVSVEISNLGERASGPADVLVLYDATPGRREDDPDGITDAETGFSFRIAGSGSVAGVPGFFDREPGRAAVEFDWDVPLDLRPGRYRLEASVRITGGEPDAVPGNDSGAALSREVEVR